MSKIIIGRKIGMTRVFTEKGMETLTMVQAMPNTVIAIRTDEKDGYSATILGAGEEKAKKINKSLTGQLKLSGASPKLINEFKANDSNLKSGEKVDVGQFETGDIVLVTGTTKGKGYAGNIKRHGFHRGPTTHGSDHHRAPGSIGSAYPQRVFKGKKMAGHLGRVTSQCQSIVHQILESDNVILLSGSLPGPKGTWLKIQAK